MIRTSALSIPTTKYPLISPKIWKHQRIPSLLCHITTTTRQKTLSGAKQESNYSTHTCFLQMQIPLLPTSPFRAFFSTIRDADMAGITNPFRSYQITTSPIRNPSIELCPPSAQKRRNFPVGNPPLGTYIHTPFQIPACVLLLHRLLLHLARQNKFHFLKPLLKQSSNIVT